MKVPMKEWRDPLPGWWKSPLAILLGCVAAVTTMLLVRYLFG